MALTDIKVPGVRKPIIQYVYLVQDVSDAARMGGTPENTYTTFQSAYDAADALQILLGGTNKVVILVGVASVLGIGNCVVTDWNANVILVGLQKETSVIGSITVTGANPATITLKDITLGSSLAALGISSPPGLTLFMENAQVGTVTTTAAGTNSGSLTITAVNSRTGSVISNNTTSGNSGNITFTNCSNLTTDLINQVSNDGNVGTFTMTRVYDSSVALLTRNALSAVNNTTLGDFAISNCANVIFGSNITMSIINPASTGTNNVFIGRSNRSIMFSGVVSILGCSTGARSDVSMNIQLVNCVFNNQLNINNAGVFVTERGGWIKNLYIQDCKFYHRARIVNWPINPQTVDPVGGGDLIFDIRDCSFAKGVTSAGLYIQNNDVSYGLFTIKACESNDFNVGIALGIDITVPPVITWMLDGGYIDIQNVKSNLSVQTYDPVLNSAPYCAIISNCNGNALYLAPYEDFNFKINMCNYDYTGYEWGHGVLPLTRPWYINSSRLGAETGNFSFNWGGAGGPLDLVIKDSYFGFYTDVLNPQTVSLLSVYNSFIESIADAGSTSTYTGTLFTSTIRRLLTESVAGLTLNNSYDDAY